MALWEVLKGLFGLAIAGAGSFLIYKSRESVFSFTARHSLSVGFIAGGLVALLISNLYSRHVYQPRFSRMTDLDFILKEKEIVLQYKSRTELVYTKKIALRALRSVDSYQDKYRWTGSGAVKLRSGVPGQTVRKVFKKNVWQFYEIRFPGTLTKNQEIKTEIICDLSDGSRAHVPFISATVDEPTEILKFSLIVPDTLAVRECVCEISNSITAKNALESETKQVDSSGRVTWIIDKPKLLYHYEMKWTLRERADDEYRADSATQQA